MRALMLSFQFPPQADTSGVQRAARFVQDLAPLGWDCSVITAQPGAYERIDAGTPPPLPAGTRVHRVFAPDVKRHFSLAGRYPARWSRPDRWIAWVPLAVAAGLRCIRRERPDVLWSSYPIPSAHLAAYWLSRLSGLPWVADFRDPMAHDGYPADPALWRSFRRIEDRVFAQAARCVFTTEGAAALYRQRFPARAADCSVIPNGFDDSAFAAAEALRRARQSDAAPAPAVPDATPAPARPWRLLHSGVVYPEWRDPDNMFAAVAALRRDAAGLPPLTLDFRASGHDAFVLQRAQAHGVQDLLRLLPALPYVEALAEMLDADALLLLQSAGCNDQIPAKVYEYLRARRPILGLAAPQGQTGQLLARAGQPHAAALEDGAQVRQALQALLHDLGRRAASPAPDHLIDAASRRHRAAELAALFDTLCGKGRPLPAGRSTSSQPLA